MNAPPKRTLLVLRHAKSSWEGSAPDHLRPLSGRGVRDGVAAGRILAGYPLEVVLCSSARRTRQTWERAVVGGARAPEVRFEDGLYFGGTRAALALLRDLDDDVATALVVGHEPTVSDVVARLAAAPHLMVEGRFPTAALAVLEVPGEWSGLTEGAAEIVRFEVPRA